MSARPGVEAAQVAAADGDQTAWLCVHYSLYPQLQRDPPDEARL